MCTGSRVTLETCRWWWFPISSYCMLCVVISSVILRQIFFQQETTVSYVPLMSLVRVVGDDTRALPTSVSTERDLLSCSTALVRQHCPKCPVMSPVSPTRHSLLHVYRSAIILELPLQVWDVIADFIYADVLSQVCRRLEEVLGSRRYVKLTCRAAHSAESVASIANNVRSLQLQVKGWWDPTAAVTVLNSAPYLHTLSLGSMLYYRGVQTACALVALKDAPALHTLHLNLIGVEVGDGGAQILAALKESRSLQHLMLRLGENRIGDTGAQALAALKDTPSLETLALNLSENQVGDAGAQALAALKDAPLLRVLHLQLGWNFVSQIGAQALAALKDTARLHTLKIDVGWNQIGAEGSGPSSAEGRPFAAFNDPHSSEESRGGHPGARTCSTEGCPCIAQDVPQSLME